MNARRLSISGWAVAPVVVAAATGGPFVLARFAYHDDWTFLTSSFERGLGAAPTGALQDARPLYALLTELSWLPVSAVEHLGALRLLSLLGVLAYAGVVGRWLRSRAVEPPLAWLAAAGTALLAPFVLFSAWAVCWPFPWAAAAALRAGAALLDRPPPAEWRTALPPLLAIVATMLVYPPSALAALVPAVVNPVVDRRPTAGSRPLRDLVWAALAFAAGTAVAFLLWQVALRALAPGVARGERVRVVASKELVAKVLWFVREPLPRGLDVLSSPSRFVVPLGIGVVIAAVVVASLRRRGRPVAASALAIALGLSATYAATWLPSGSYFAYRTVVAPATAFWLLLTMVGGETLAGLAGGRTRARVATWALAGIVALTSVRVVAGFTLPLIDIHRRELATLRSEAARVVAAEPRRVLMRQIDWREARRAGWFAEMNAFPSATDRWYARSMVTITTGELGRPFAGEFELIGADVTALPALREGDLLIDYRERFSTARDRPARLENRSHTPTSSRSDVRSR